MKQSELERDGGMLKGLGCPASEIQLTCFGSTELGTECNTQRESQLSLDFE
jgi:hypothetical protein